MCALNMLCITLGDSLRVTSVCLCSMDSEGGVKGLCEVGSVSFHTVKNFFGCLLRTKYLRVVGRTYNF